MSEKNATTPPTTEHEPKGRHAYCTVCGRDVGLVTLGGLTGSYPGYRLARHATVPLGRSRQRRPICTGSGVTVTAIEIHDAPGTRRNG